MDIYLIRHAQTQGNIEHRYIGGRTDEPLSEAGIACFCNMAYPAAERVYVSPMLRCKQTAEILYPLNRCEVIPELRECDFGSFEGKSYRELENDPVFRGWIDGKCAPPGGEPKKTFQERCCGAFVQSVSQAFLEGLKSVAFVVHGGTIMSVMERFAEPARNFYEWQVENMGGWAASASMHQWTEQKNLTVLRKIMPGG